MFKSIGDFFSRAFSANSLLHGALMAGISAAGTAVLPIAGSLAGGSPIDPINFGHIGGMALGTAVVYLIKNGIAGSSTKSLNDKAQ